MVQPEDTTARTEGAMPGVIPAPVGPHENTDSAGGVDKPEPKHKAAQEAHRGNVPWDTDTHADTLAGEDELLKVGRPEVAWDTGPVR